MICSQLTSVPGSSRWFAGGAVAYSNHAKERMAGVHATTISRHGAASAKTAAAMAAGVRGQLGADWGLAETGVAGPQTGRRSTKPTGLTYLAVCGPAERGTPSAVRPLQKAGVSGAPATRRRPMDRVVVEEVRTGRDDRAANQRAFAEATLDLLLRTLEASQTKAKVKPAVSAPDGGVGSIVALA